MSCSLSSSPTTTSSASISSTGFKEEDFECLLCLRLLYEPTTLKCGHSFCRTCCRSLFQQNHAKCPTCRKLLPVVHYYASEEMILPSYTLCRMLEQAFPIQYEQRRSEEEGDKQATSCTLLSSSSYTKSPTTVLPIFYLDPMLPRQRMQLNIFEYRYIIMVSRCLEGSRTFGMIGFSSQRSRTSTGASASTSSNTTSAATSSSSSSSSSSSMPYGVEVEIVESSPQPSGTIHIEVRAKRRFVIEGETWVQDGYAMAKVKWLKLPESSSSPLSSPPLRSLRSTTTNVCTSNGYDDDGDERQETNQDDNNNNNTTTSTRNSEEDAIQTTQEEGEINNNNTSDGTNLDDSLTTTGQVLKMARELESLVEEWKSLVISEGWQRYHGQLAQTLSTIGEMPAADDVAGAVDRALWVGALINPLPGMGVAPEIRPALLENAASEDYLLILRTATHGIRQSIEYLTPNAVILWVQYQFKKYLFRRNDLGPPPPLPGTHQLVNAMIRFFVFILVFSFFWSQILTPKTSSIVIAAMRSDSTSDDL